MMTSKDYIDVTMTTELLQSSANQINVHFSFFCEELNPWVNIILQYMILKLTLQFSLILG